MAASCSAEVTEWHSAGPGPACARIPGAASLALLQKPLPAILVSEVAVDGAFGDFPMTHDFKWRHFRGEIILWAVR